MKFKPFDELFEIPLRNGLTKPKRVRGEGYKMINMGELFKYPRMKNIPMDRVPLTEKEYSSSMVQAGDLLFARQSLILEGAGQCSIFLEDDEEVCFESHLIRCRLDKKIANPIFYYNYFTSRIGKQVIAAIVEQGAGAAGVRGSDLAKVQVPEVDLESQNEVARIVNELDEKIELNRQTNQTLEEMAQAIFKSWFVDFEPTRAKIAAKEEWAKRSLTAKVGGNDENAGAIFVERAAMAAISGLPTISHEAQAAGAADDQLNKLPPEQFETLKSTAALFPDALVDSALGEIPEGWVKGELRDIAKFSTDRTSVSELSLETYISTENMLERKKGVTNATSLPTVKTVPSFHPGQILISNIRPYFMKIWLARFDGGRSNDVLGIEANETESTEYLYNLLYQDTFFNFMLATSKGAKMPRGDKNAIMGWHCVQPTLEVKKSYSKVIKEFYSRIDSANKENKTLEQLRDTLLPKLLSGELSTVPDKESAA